MASKATLVDFIVEQLGAGVSSKRMFGEYGLYKDGVMFALVCDDQLFMKPTEAGRTFLGKLDEAPPYPGAKPAFRISGDKWDDGEWMAELAKITWAGVKQAAPKKKVKAKAKPKAARAAKLTKTQKAGKAKRKA